MKKLLYITLLSLLFCPLSSLIGQTAKYTFIYIKDGAGYTGEIQYQVFLSYRKTGVGNGLNTNDDPVNIDLSKSTSGEIYLRIAFKELDWPSSDKRSGKNYDNNHLIIKRKDIEFDDQKLTLLKPEFQLQFGLENKRNFQSHRYDISFKVKPSISVPAGGTITIFPSFFYGDPKIDLQDAKRLSEKIVIIYSIKDANSTSPPENNVAFTGPLSPKEEAFAAACKELEEEAEASVSKLKTFLAEFDWAEGDPCRERIKESLNRLTQEEKSFFKKLGRINEVVDPLFYQQYLDKFAFQKYDNKDRFNEVKSALDQFLSNQSNQVHINLIRDTRKKEVKDLQLTARTNQTVKAYQELISYCNDYPGLCSEADLREYNASLANLKAIESKNAEENLWRKVKRTKAYYQYIRAYPNGKHIEEAKELQKQQRSTIAIENYHQENFDLVITVMGQDPYSATNPFKIKGLSDEIISKAEWGKDGEQYLLTLKKLDVGSYSLKLFNKLDKNTTLDFNISLPQKPRIVSLNDLGDGNYSIEIEEGQPPFRLQFIPKEGGEAKTIDNVGHQYDYRFTNKDVALPEGEYEVKVLDVRGVPSDSKEIKLVGVQNYTMLITLITIATILAWVIAFYFLSKKFKNWVDINVFKRSKKLEEIKRNHFKEPRENREIKESETSANIKISPQRKRITIKRKEDMESLPAGANIDKLEDLHTIEYFLSITSGELKNQFFVFNLNEIWKDTMVEKVYMKFPCAQAIDVFVRDNSRINPFEEGEEEEVPEVGGFLMGAAQFNPRSGKYNIAIEAFVPATQEQNDVYQVGFLEQAWIDYNRALENYPNLKPIGWFHTHPGHGLFLSKNDLRVHGQFSEDYQVAMEIDSKSEELDTAFFTRNSTGRMNNSANRISRGEKIEWFSWIKVDKWMRVK